MENMGYSQNQLEGFVTRQSTENLDEVPTLTTMQCLILQVIQKIGFAQTSPMKAEEGLTLCFTCFSRTGVYI